MQTSSSIGQPLGEQQQQPSVEFCHIATALLKDAAEASSLCRNKGNAHLKAVLQHISALSATTAGTTVKLCALIPLIAEARQLLNSYNSAVRVLHKALLEVGTAERKWNKDATHSSSSSTSSAVLDGSNGSVPTSAPLCFLAFNCCPTFVNALLAGTSNHLYALSICTTHKFTVVAAAGTGGGGGGAGTAGGVSTAKPVTLLSLVLCTALGPAVGQYEASEMPLGEDEDAVCADRFTAAAAVVGTASDHHRQHLSFANRDGSLVPGAEAMVAKGVRQAGRALDLFKKVQQLQQSFSSSSSSSMLSTAAAAAAQTAVGTAAVGRVDASAALADAILADKLLFRLVKLSRAVLGVDHTNGGGGTSISGGRRALVEGLRRILGNKVLDANALAEVANELALIERMP